MSELLFLAETLRACAEIANDSKIPEDVRVAFGLGDFQDYEYTDAFVLEIVGDASIFLSPDASLGGEPLERIEGFHRALGGEPQHNSSSLVSQLIYYASLLEATEENRSDPGLAEILRRIRSSYLFEHMLVWIPMYVSYLEGLFPKLTNWSAALLDVLGSEAQSLGVVDWDLTPSALKDRPTLASVDLNTGLEVFASPYVTGFIVSRSLFKGIAEQYGIAPRVGTRKFMLSSLFEQDAGLALEVMTAVADAQVELWKSLESEFGVSATSWRRTAEASKDELIRARKNLTTY